MALGHRKVKKSSSTKSVVKNTEQYKNKVMKKVAKLSKAIRIPPPVNQFSVLLSEGDEKKILDLLKKYSPETKKEKRERLKLENPKAGAKPILLKFGMKHIVELIEGGRLKYCVIATDVDPITTIVFLPTLCKRYNVPYCLVSSQSTLGNLVHQKRTVCVGLEGVRNEDGAELEEVINMSNAVYADKYDEHMKQAGGSAAKKNYLEEGIVNK